MYSSHFELVFTEEAFLITDSLVVLLKVTLQQVVVIVKALFAKVLILVLVNLELILEATIAIAAVIAERDIGSIAKSHA